MLSESLRIAILRRSDLAFGRTAFIGLAAFLLLLTRLFRLSLALAFELLKAPILVGKFLQLRGLAPGLGRILVVRWFLGHGSLAPVLSRLLPRRHLGFHRVHREQTRLE